MDRSLFDGIRDKSPTLNKAILDIRWPLLRFILPSKAFGLMPHFAIVAHEIGHEIFGRINWDLQSFKNHDQIVNQKICSRTGKVMLSPSAVLFKQQVFLKWFQEIVSDAFGHLMTGPAFFFAICGLIQTIGAGLGISPTHPSNIFRRELLFKKLTEANGFAEVFKKHTGTDLKIDINSGLFEPLPSDDQLYLQLLTRFKNDEQAAVLVELPSYLKAISDYIYIEAEKYLDGVTPTLIYTPTNLDDDLAEHLHNLVHAIPPIEGGTSLENKKPIDFTTTLNVGWVAFLTRLEGIVVKPDGSTPLDVLRSEKLHGLLMKGLELAEAKRKWGSV